MLKNSLRGYRQPLYKRIVFPFRYKATPHKKTNIPQKKIVYYNSHSFCSSNKNDQNKQSKKPGMFATLKKLGRKYILIYAFLYLGCLLVVYLLFETNILSIDKTVEKYNYYNLNKYLDLYKYKEKLGDKYSNLAIAIVLNELVEVIRFPLFLYIVIKLIKK